MKTLVQVQHVHACSLILIYIFPFTFIIYDDIILHEHRSFSRKSTLILLVAGIRHKRVFYFSKHKQFRHVTTIKSSEHFVLYVPFNVIKSKAQNLIQIIAHTPTHKSLNYS